MYWVSFQSHHAQYCLKNANDRMFLVPSKLSDEEFWTRFFFRVYQIETEEEKRKVLLQGKLTPFEIENE